MSTITHHTDTPASRDNLVERGQHAYDQQLKNLLEPKYTGHYVAIEPESGRYFLADTGTAALLAARAEMPDTLFYLVRVGYRAADTIRGYGTRGR